MNLKAFSLNEIGGRKNVEDAIMPKQYTPQAPKLFIVCDGVGGSSFGEVASDIATKSFYEIFEKAAIGSETDFKNLLQTSLMLFRNRVSEFISAHPAAANTSTTFTLLTIHQDKAYIAWCGDSKVFHIRNRKPIFRTRDHSLVAELTAQGVITEKEAETHPQKNIITRSLNANTKPGDIDTAIVTGIQSGDWFLLCTDGLMEQFTEPLFGTVLGRFNEATNYSGEIDKICYGKTNDNYSMYLIYVEQAAKKGSARKILLPLLLLTLAAGSWLAYNQLMAKKEIPVSQGIENKDTGEVKSIMMAHPVEGATAGNDSAAPGVTDKRNHTKKDTTKP